MEPEVSHPSTCLWKRGRTLQRAEFPACVCAYLWEPATIDTFNLLAEKLQIALFSGLPFGTLAFFFFKRSFYELQLESIKPQAARDPSTTKTPLEFSVM